MATREIKALQSAERKAFRAFQRACKERVLLEAKLIALKQQLAEIKDTERLASCVHDRASYELESALSYQQDCTE